MNLRKLTNYLNGTLESERFRDYAPNGLQVEGKADINKIITGVTASQALLDIAVEKKADAVLVHHGYFWKGEYPCIVGMKQQRIATLLKNDISLLGYHLPLDAHQEFGNNIQLAKQLDLRVTGPLNTGDNPAIAFQGELMQPMSGEAFAQHIETKLQRAPLHIAADREIKTIAWCTGAAQDYIDHAIAAGVDAFITGEVSERTYHSAQENNIHFFGAGHHATERYGVKALGEHIAENFGVEVEFVDVGNPV